MVRLAVALAICLASTGAHAVETMICKNPHQAYLVVFDPSARSLTLDPDTDAITYLVLAVERGKRSVVAGMVGYDSGLGFAAEFAPSPEIRFYDNEKLFQTDTCRRK